MEQRAIVKFLLHVLLQIPGLLSTSSNGSLIFPSFSSHSYSSSVHAASYYCVGRFQDGALLSLPVNVRAGKEYVAQYLMKYIYIQK